MIIFNVMYQGTTVPPEYTSAFAAMSPVSHTKHSTDLRGIAALAMLSNDSPACQHGTVYHAFPVGSVSFDISGLRKAYDILASVPKKLKSSWMIFEGYSMRAVQAVPEESTVVPDRYVYLWE